MTHFILTRHGESVWHAENRYAGSSDIDLTTRGLEQADNLASWARTANLTAVWTSPLTRAKVTASASAHTTGLRVQIDPRLRELDFGKGEGLTTSDMRQEFGPALEAFHADPVAHHLPGGEDPRDATARFIEGLDEIEAQQPQGRILVVAHTTVIRLVLCQLIGVPLSEYRRLLPSMRNCGLTVIRREGAYTALLEYNTPTEPK